jgi:proteasome assembly chaperone (PAC2) family protein
VAPSSPPAHPGSSDLRWERVPELRRPVLIASFEGWNDAGDAASGALAHLADVWEAEPFADIDPEDYFDFSSTRPEVRLNDGLTREIVWPTNEFLVAPMGDSGRDVVLLAGDEPQLRWRTFCERIIEVATTLKVEMVVTFGALLADVPHTRPVRITGTAGDASLVERLGLQRSRYEGPTGIVGVLHDYCAKAGIPSCSLWAAVPHYLPSTTSPKAALALIERASELLSVAIPTLALEVASVEYERQVNEVVEADEEMVGFLAQLEANHDEGDDDDDVEDNDESEVVDARTAFSDAEGKLLTGDALAEELEKFLREQGR